jgi:dTDP-4-dehydrorhamnose 3,5-epimerase-like enzyme
MDNKPSLIKGNFFNDARGQMRFVNDFKMDEVKRFYIIRPEKGEEVRAWQGHKIEAKYFYCLKGSFTVAVINLENCLTEVDKPQIDMFELSEKESNMLNIPGGYVNGFKAQVQGAELMVFSDCSLLESGEDDFRFDKNKWLDWGEI